MPTYQYVCTDCGEALEVQQSFTDDSLTTCPACGGKLRKVFNAVGVVFKGSGFYRNDSRAAAQSGSDAGSGEDKSGSRSDTVSAGADKGGTEKKAEAKGGAEKSGRTDAGGSAPAKTATGSAA